MRRTAYVKVVVGRSRKGMALNRERALRSLGRAVHGLETHGPALHGLEAPDVRRVGFWLADADRLSLRIR